MTKPRKNKSDNILLTRWPSGFDNSSCRRLGLLLSIGICMVLACSTLGSKPPYTENSQANVVKLRNDIIDLAKGSINEIVGRTERNETYILLYGYPERSLDSLGIPETLREKIEAISPSLTERYVLAHTIGSDIKEYTEWTRSSRLLSPVPLLIRGDPFRITPQVSGEHWVDLKIEP